MDKPWGEQLKTYRCLSLVIRAAVSTQLFCSCMRNLVTRWLMDGWVGRSCRTAVLVLMSFGERSGRTVMPVKGRNGLPPAVWIPGEILPFVEVLEGFLIRFCIFRGGFNFFFSRWKASQPSNFARKGNRKKQLSFGASPEETAKERGT